MGIKGCAKVGGGEEIEVWMTVHVSNSSACFVVRMQERRQVGAACRKAYRGDEMPASEFRIEASASVTLLKEWVL